jgi:hypothetical protein
MPLDWASTPESARWAGPDSRSSTAQRFGTPEEAQRQPSSVGAICLGPWSAGGMGAGDEVIDQRFLTAGAADHGQFYEIDAFPEFAPDQRPGLALHGRFRDEGHA